MTTDEMIEVLQAYKDGKSIEYRSKDAGNLKWHGLFMPVWDFCMFEYRIKQESEYRPYKNTDEMVADYDARFQSKARLDHTMPLIWVKGKRQGRYLIEGYSEDGNGVYVNYVWKTLSNLFSYFTYLDGTPCGKLEER